MISFSHGLVDFGLVPEHILTQKLSPYFDVAIEQESHNAPAPSTDFNASWNSGMRRGPGLPSSQKPASNMHTSTASMSSALACMSSTSSSSAFPHPNLRKPPSLSTLAMPSFSGMRPASHNLISALRSLIVKLPRENRDLLRTVVELINATAKESKMTKMPLSNLLMVFLPSLNISAQLLRVLCEEERIWFGLVGGEQERRKENRGEVVGGAEGEDKDEVLDVKRDTVVLDIKRESGDDHQRREKENCDGEGEEEDEEEEIDAHRRWTVVNRPEVPTVYLDSRSQASSASVASSALVSSSRDASVSSTTESSMLPDDVSSDRHFMQRDAMLSSSVESVLTPLTSSAQSSMANLPLGTLDTAKNLSAKGGVDATGAPGGRPGIRVVEPAPLGLEIDVVSGADENVAEREEGQTRTAIGSSLQYASSHSPPPTATMTTTPEKNLPQTPLSPRRRSIPALSFPSLSAFTNGHHGSHRSPSSGSHGSEPASPAESLASTTGGKNGSLRAKKPSLRLLFSHSKKSTGSLNGSSREVVAVNTPGSAPGSASSFNLNQQQMRTASMVLASAWSVDGQSGSSGSSVSTPISAVTAPATAVGSAGAGSSMLELPPVLDTPIEEGPSLRLELGLGESPPGTATAPGQQQQGAEEEAGKGKEKKERIKTMVGQTPIADWYSTKSAASSVVDLPTPPPQHKPSPDAIAGLRGLDSADDEDDGDDEDDFEARRRTVMGRGRGASVSSQLSMNHLGLEDEELGGEEDWTSSVLLAAEFELRCEGKV